jgi:ElaB/YqjD/DUF883 family membrane-anchored ribosome-binding protein
MTKKIDKKTGENKRDKRPSLFEENSTLKETIKALQDQNTNLTESNHELDKQNSILEERLANFGLRDFCKNAGWAGIGVAAGVGFTGQAATGLAIAIGSSTLIMIFSIYDNIFVKQKDKKEKVGI